MPTAQADWEKWFEKIWADREENIYVALFGGLGKGIVPMTPAVFEQLGCPQPDPRWLFHGVFACPPTHDRPTWLYVTSGLSNPWGDDPASINPEAYSGLGMELMLQTNVEAVWPVRVLHWIMAIQLLIAAGQVQGEFLTYMDRAPLRAPIDGQSSELRTLLIAEPAPFPRQFQLASGKVDLMMCVGITDRENDFARTQGSPELASVLEHHHCLDVTEPLRTSVI